MTVSPVAHADALRVGTVDFVSPDELRVLLEIDAPEVVALNAGGARPFPRVNGYVLIPVENGMLVGQVVWLTVERSAFPKRRGVQDFGLIDLPYPLRKMRLNPLGILERRGTGSPEYRFSRGADTLPSIGSPVLLPSNEQLRAIVQSGDDGRVLIGTSPLADGAQIKVNPDKLFGRHLAVLGNTGSGKSCTVAGLIRWSIDAVRQQLEDTEQPRVRFIILDPNGEYAKAFSPQGGIQAQLFQVEPSPAGLPLEVPAWFWNSAEWSAFSQASARMQRPLLKRALREMKAGAADIGGADGHRARHRLRRVIATALIQVRVAMNTGSGRTDTKFGFQLKAIDEDLRAELTNFPDLSLASIVEKCRAALDANFNTFVGRDGERVEHYRPFSNQVLTPIVDAMVATLEQIGGVPYYEGPDEDVPLPFVPTELADHIERLGEQENVSQFVEYLVSRIRSILADAKLGKVIGDGAMIDLATWLNQVLGSHEDGHQGVSIIDLSLVPTDAVHVIAAVTARIVFEALQRARAMSGESVPTVLVMEEAHTFVRRYREEAESPDGAAVCCKVFERIAREGRKFGLGLCLSSQRPSELSPTVLSQCNTVLLHRISNDRDQDMVNRLVPDALTGMLRELPSLPTQHAILLGWASQLPLLVRLRDLAPEQRPDSRDPGFWDAWTSGADGAIHQPTWKQVADRWQGKPDTGSDVDGSSSPDGGQEEQ